MDRIFITIRLSVSRDMLLIAINDAIAAQNVVNRIRQSTSCDNTARIPRSAHNVSKPIDR